MLRLPATYTTFAELAEYAKERAKISAARRAPQDFEYWYSTMEWAQRCGTEEPGDVILMMVDAIDRYGFSVSSKAEYHAHAIHCRVILKNRGEKPPRLSLNWLREAAEKL